MKKRPSMLLVLALSGAGAAMAGQTGPGVEERPAVTAGASVAPAATNTLAGDVSVAVFEQFQQFQSQVETLTGRVEELEHALSQAREQERARYVDLDARIKALEQAAQRPAEPAPLADAQASGGADEKALFDRGRALVREKKYDEAIGAFEQQLKQFPRGELVPNAMYWLGQMWKVAAQPDVPKAGRYFYRVYNEYPKSTLASNAMYEHGLIQCQDDVPKGRVTLNRVIVQYPGSPDAKLADSALKQQCR